MKKKLTLYVLLLIASTTILVGVGIYWVSHEYTQSLVQIIIQDTEEIVTTADELEGFYAGRIQHSCSRDRNGYFP